MGKAIDRQAEYAETMANKRALFRLPAARDLLAYTSEEIPPFAMLCDEGDAHYLDIGGEG